jgi:hypothetical protein
MKVRTLRHDAPPSAMASSFSARLATIDDHGALLVQPGAGERLWCDWLEGAPLPTALVEGDELLVTWPAGRDRPVVIGRIGAYKAPAPTRHLVLEASESLHLKCGDSSIDLRADGKLMVRGDDVLVRAKGTQRIRAGSVSIN